MKSSCNSIFVAFLLLALGAYESVAQQPLATTVKQITYGGWDDSYEISNAFTRVVVTPSVGRITHFSRHGEENLLYLNPDFAGKRLTGDRPMLENGKPIWATFGGDRIWPTEESLFAKVNGSKRPPDYDIDGLPWEFELLKDGVAMTSRVSRFCGAEVRREIRLQPSLSSLFISQTMTKHEAAEPDELAPLPMTIWNISKVQNADVIFFPVYQEDATKQLDQSSLVIPVWEVENHAPRNLKLEDGLVYLYPGQNEHQKLGGLADGWIAMIKEDRLFVQKFDFDPTATYPDGGTSATTWMGSGLAELECLSPLVSLKPGESIQHNLEWFACVLKEDSLEDRIKEALQIMRAVTHKGPGIITY